MPCTENKLIRVTVVRVAIALGSMITRRSRSELNVYGIPYISFVISGNRVLSIGS